MPPPPSSRRKGNRRQQATTGGGGGVSTRRRKNLREKDPMQYYSRKIDRYLDAHPWFTMVLTQCLLFLTVAIVWMIFGEKIQKVHFERVKPYLREHVWPKVLKFSRENLPEKWQLSERVVEKVTQNLGNGAESASS
ncbi:unnamed protein product [Bathycoccus prasinos]